MQVRRLAGSIGGRPSFFLTLFFLKSDECGKSQMLMVDAPLVGLGLLLEVLAA
jgi:hypothetical protein